METVVLYLNATDSVGEEKAKPIYLPSPMLNATSHQIALMRHAMTGSLTTDERFMELAQRYAEGNLEPFEMARLMGPAWTEFDVIHELQARGLRRSLATIVALPAKKADETLAWLRDIRVNGRAGDFLTPKDIAREVISTQNIESIDARMHLGRQEHP